jgi:hypothetical protein
MFERLKNSKHALGWRIIVGIILLALSVGVIIFLILYFNRGADEKSQIEWCEATNKARWGKAAMTFTLGKSAEADLCSTIYKVKKDSQVPMEPYPQDEEGAKAEIREMIKNCWDEWLKGSVSNIFLDYPGEEPCFACYIFKIKEDVEGVTLDSISDSMIEQVFVKDTSDQCTPNGGFYASNLGSLDNTCPENWRKFTSKKADNEGEICCLRKDMPNECENRGGKCFTKDEYDPSLGYDKIYLKWSCPKAKQRCYTKSKDSYSYSDYIRSGGGTIFFTIGDTGDIDDPGGTRYDPGQEYAISFVSPSPKSSFPWDEGRPSLGGWILEKIGLKYLAVKWSEINTWGQLTDKPNYIIVSSSEDMQRLGCIIK